MRTKPPKDNWYAWALVAVAALVFTNAGWFYRWKVREVEHVEAVNAVVAAQPAKEPRVVYEYRQADPPAATQPSPARSLHGQPRALAPGEACFGGVIVRRDADRIESTGERCR